MVSTTVQTPAADEKLEQAFRSFSMEDIPNAVLRKAEDFNESDDLASASSSNSSSSSDGEEGSGSDSSGSNSQEDVEMEESENLEEKAPSGGDESELNKSAPKLGSAPQIKEEVEAPIEVVQTDQNQTSQKDSEESESEDQSMDDLTVFAGFTLEDLTSTGFLDRPELLAGFETSMFWLVKRLGSLNNFYDS